MNNNEQSTVGALIAARRKECGINGQALADRIGIQRSTLFRIEHGRVKPSTESLVAIARELDIDQSELLAAAGYDDLAQLPTFTSYLRSKYPDMPEEARQDLAAAFQRIAKKHGFDPSAPGPLPGEDE